LIPRFEGEPFLASDVFWLLMTLLPRKGLLAIAAVVDVALQTGRRPISAKTLATRHGLPPRHLESVLQSLVRDGILKGIRGPRGGYELARDRRGVTWPTIFFARQEPSTSWKRSQVRS
jgi:Rrf2 family iron-sulfur cluster assembly transcriptional regulator